MAGRTLVVRGAVKIILLAFSLLAGIAAGIGIEPESDGLHAAGDQSSTFVVPDEVRHVSQASAGLVFDHISGKLYTSVPSFAINGNSIRSINLETSAVGAPVFIGSDPGQLAITDNGQYIYAALNGSAAIRRFDVPTETAGLQFSLGSSPYFGPRFPHDLAVMAGSPETIVVATYYPPFSPSSGGVWIYDNGVARPNWGSGNVIAASDSAPTIYGYNNETSGFEFFRMPVDANGFYDGTGASNLLYGYGVDIEYDSGRIYSTSGRVVDPEALQLVATYPITGLVEPDSAHDRTFFLTGGGGNYTIYAYTQSTFQFVGSLSVSIAGGPRSFIRWGNDGLAVGTWDEVVIIESCRLMPSPGDSDCDTVLDASDNCPTDPNADQLNTDGDPEGDACDDDDDNDLVSDASEGACGSDPLSSSSLPERTDTAGDDDGDGLVNEALPPGSAEHDCDGDGFNGRVEQTVFSAADTANDQKRCGVDAWPADVNDDGLVDIIGDISRVAGQYGNSVPPAPRRYDFAPDPPDGLIDVIGEIVRMAALFGRSCN